jgi:hypothetical protein
MKYLFVIVLVAFPAMGAEFHHPGLLTGTAVAIAGPAPGPAYLCAWIPLEGTTTTVIEEWLCEDVPLSGARFPAIAVVPEGWQPTTPIKVMDAKWAWHLEDKRWQPLQAWSE